MNRALVISIASAGLAVMIGSGVRSSFGIFLLPISESLGTGREVFSFAVGVNTIVFGLPLAGMIADWIGSRLVLVGGGLLYAAGLILMTTATEPFMLTVSMGLFVGLALSAVSFVVVLGAVGQLVTPESRSRTFGLITAMGSSGMFVVPPVAQFLLSQWGWQTALLILAVIAASVMVCAFGLPSARIDRTGLHGVEEPFSDMMLKAARHSGYLLLVTGFFVCGFHVSFVGIHLHPYLTDSGLSAEIATAALSLIGGFNIAGSYLFGWLGDRYRKKYLLSFIYFGRAVAFCLFFFLPVTQTSALIFAAAIGFLWLATVPLTSGTVAQIFGPRYLSTLYGIAFLSHQIGGFLGVWLAGKLYDSTGTYELVWYLSMALGVFAALIHAPIADEPLRARKIETPQPA